MKTSKKIQILYHMWIIYIRYYLIYFKRAHSVVFMLKRDCFNPTEAGAPKTASTGWTSRPETDSPVWASSPGTNQIRVFDSRQQVSQLGVR